MPDMTSQKTTASQSDPLPFSVPIPGEAGSASSDPSLPPWLPILMRLPLGIALLKADSGATLWGNATLQTMLREEVGQSYAVGQPPWEYMPGLNRSVWEPYLQAEQPHRLHGDRPSPQRVQFVHASTRNITYWEWQVLPLESQGPAAHLLLLVEEVSDRVMSERLLATAGRTANRARQRAEALGRLTQMINATLQLPELTRALVEEAADYYETGHVALLLTPASETFQVGHSLGIDAPQGYVDRLNRERQGAAHQAVQSGRCSLWADTGYPSGPLPQMADGSKPTAMISCPIRQDTRTYGVVEVYFSHAQTIPEEGSAMLEAFADQAAFAFQRADLYHQLAEQRRQLQSIFDNAPVSIVYFDMQGCVVAINADASLRYGQSVEAAIGKEIHAFLPNISEEILTNVRAGTPFHASHFPHPMPTGRTSICDLSLLPVRDDAGQVVGLLLLGFEVTELVQARQEAETARLSAENALAEVRSAQSQMVQMEKMRAIGELASGVAHDFNNALMTILGYTELAEDSLESAEQVANYLQIVKKATLDASSTVQRLQSFARQRSITHARSTDLNEIVRDVVQMTRPRWKDEAQKQGKVYQVETHLEGLPPVLVEPSGIREVLINILHNALNAMPDGGKLTLTTRQHEDMLEVEIADSGIGMTPEVVQRIFDPFFTTRGVEGTGLGLAVSWTIMQRHGGTIEVQSAPGKGTRFFVRLPLADPIAHEGDASATALPTTPPGRHILVVDDEPLVASVLTGILSRHGHRVTTANSAEAALERLRETDADYELLLTDHGMPGMTGLQLIAEVRDRWPDVPIILLTGWGQSLMQTHAADALPDVVLGKPINQSDLLNAIAQVLRETKENGNRST